MYHDRDRRSDRDHSEVAALAGAPDQAPAGAAEAERPSRARGGRHPGRRRLTGRRRPAAGRVRAEPERPGGQLHADEHHDLILHDPVLPWRLAELDRDGLQLDHHLNDRLDVLHAWIDHDHRSTEHDEHADDDHHNLLYHGLHAAGHNRPDHDHGPDRHLTFRLTVRYPSRTLGDNHVYVGLIPQTPDERCST